MTNASLTSPMPIPAGRRSRRRAGTRPPPRRRSGARVCPSGRVSARIASAATVPAIMSLFGMIRKSMSITVTGTSSSTNASPSQTSSSGADHDHGEGHQQRRRELDERIAPGDRLAADAAAPPQQQPREHRDVVVRLDRRVAARAARGRRRQRLAARQPVGHDVEERAEEQARGSRPEHALLRTGASRRALMPRRARGRVVDGQPGRDRQAAGVGAFDVAGHDRGLDRAC